MKLNKIFTGLCGAAMLLSTSCVGDLDLEPNDPNLTFLDAEHYANVLAKCYGSMTFSGQTGPNGDCDISGLDGGTSQYTRALFMMNEFTTDEAIWIHPDNGVIDLVTNTFGKDNGNVFGTYSRLYSHIAICNDFIRQAKSSDIPEVQEMVLQARALRAMSYYWVIDIFGQGSFSTEEQPYGEAPEQVSREYLYNWLDNELSEIETAYKTNFANNKVMYGHVGLDGVQALHARLALNAKVYTGNDDFEKCQALCEEVIARHKGTGFQNSGLAKNYLYLFCASNDAYMPGGSNAGENEILWGIAYDKDFTQAYGGTQFFIKAALTNAPAPGLEGYDAANGVMAAADYGVTNTWKCMHATEQFSDKFAMSADAASDVRWSMWAKEANGYKKQNDKYGNFSDGYACIKYTNLIAGANAGGPATWNVNDPTSGCWSVANGGIYDATGNTPARAEEWVDTDLPMIRLAEVYLMYAESYVLGKKGDQTKALEYVNLVRARAGVSPWTAADLKADNMLDERCRELYWELTRRSDLVRYGKYTGGTYLWSYKGSQLNQSGTSIPSYMNLMPIPTNIIAAQPEFKQNPGY